MFFSHDADTLLVKTAVELTQQWYVEKKAEDTEVSLMLARHGANIKLEIISLIQTKLPIAF